MFDEIEDLILARLKEVEMFRGFDILPFPENFEKFSFLSGRGCLLIKYDGSTFTDPQTINFVRQNETLEFSVIAGFRYQRTLKEVYPMLKAIKKTLTGLRYNGKQLYPKKRQYIGHVKGDLYYGYVFAITLPSTETPPDNNPPKISPFAKSKIDLIA